MNRYLSAVKVPLILLGMASFAVFLIFPPSPYFINFIIVLEIGFSIVLYLRASMIKDWSDITTFPTILLLSTIFRIAVNVTTTRRILYDGNPGKVIEDFGHFVVGTNLWIGFVMFAILFVVEFIIAGGAQRISEVAARFSLDAMQGKQNSIELDLNHNFVNEEEAKQRRKSLGTEIEFYGNMDGASRFVKGDVILTIVLMVINLLAGFAVGMINQHLTFVQSLQHYTILTIGDGLVNQLCSLMVTVSAGVIMSRVSTEEGENIAQKIFSEVTKNVVVIYVVGGILIALGVIMPLPKIPFLIVGAGLIGLGYFLQRENRKKEQEDQEKMDKDAREKGNKETHAFATGVQPIALEVNPTLGGLVNEKSFSERISLMRMNIEKNLGIRVPLIRVSDNVLLKEETGQDYQILIKNVSVGGGSLIQNRLLAIPGVNTNEPIEPSIKTKEPIRGGEAYWISKEQIPDAEAKGYTPVDPASILITHLNLAIEKHLYEVIQRKDIQALLDELAMKNQRVLLDEIKVNNIPTYVIQNVVQNLIRNQISIQDFPTIVEAIIEGKQFYEHIDDIINFVREKIARHICSSVSNPITKEVDAWVVSPNRLNEANVGIKDGQYYLTMGEEENKLIQEIEKKVTEGKISDLSIVVVTQLPSARSALEKAILRRNLEIPVLSYSEIAEANGNLLGMI